MLQLKITCAGNSLTCEVKQARNLIAMDSDGLSDPHVTIKLIPKSIHTIKMQTRTIKDNLDPVWNETFVIELQPGDMDRRLLLKCWDRDISNSNDFIGSMVRKPPKNTWN